MQCTTSHHGTSTLVWTTYPLLLFNLLLALLTFTEIMTMYSLSLGSLHIKAAEWSWHYHSADQCHSRDNLTGPEMLRDTRLDANMDQSVFVRGFLITAIYPNATLDRTLWSALMHHWTFHLMQQSLLMVTKFCSLLNMSLQTFSITGSMADWRQHPCPQGMLTDSTPNHPWTEWRRVSNMPTMMRQTHFDLYPKELPTTVEASIIATHMSTHIVWGVTTFSHKLG
jgi:hypothetical protein